MSEEVCAGLARPCFFHHIYKFHWHDTSANLNTNDLTLSISIYQIVYSKQFWELISPY